METKEFLNWRILIPAGIGIWIVMWLVSFVAVLVRIAAMVLIVLGILDLIFPLFKKHKKENFEKTDAKNV